MIPKRLPLHRRSIVRWLGVIVFLVAVLTPAGEALARRHPRSQFRGEPKIASGRVIAVSDGDTFVLRSPDGENLRVRVAEIDCPELHQEFGQKARSYTASLVLERRVSIRPIDRDRYDRIVARVRLPDGRDLSEALVKAGLAWWYRAHSKDETLHRLEEEARAAKRGLWSDHDPVPPWIYRRTRPLFDGVPPGRD